MTVREKSELIALVPRVVPQKQNVLGHDRLANDAKIKICHVCTQSRHSLLGYGGLT